MRYKRVITKVKEKINKLHLNPPLKGGNPPLKSSVRRRKVVTGYERELMGGQVPKPPPMPQKDALKDQQSQPQTPQVLHHKRLPFEKT